MVGSIPANAITFEEAVRNNLKLGMQLCIGNMPDIDTTRAVLAQAGYAYTAEVFGPDKVLHWYAAPADTASVLVIGPPHPPECRVSSDHMGLTESIAWVGSALQELYPGIFTYGNMENTSPVTPANRGDRWVDCTGYVGWNGQRPIVITLTNEGNDPACIDDGTTVISINP